jgi:hypothetical protein
MRIKIRKGKLIYAKDSGSLVEQLSNLEALVRYTQKLASEMHIVADATLSVNPQLVELNKHLNAQLKAARNTVEVADKQLERNAKKGVAK